MKTLSLCMITKNEQQYLENCLSIAKNYVDEIIITDTGSTDNTKAIAEKYTKNIFDFKWDDDFSKARNFSLEKATSDWIIVLDADELISEEDFKKIKELIQDTEYDAFYLVQRNYSKKKLNSEFTLIDKKSKYTKDYEGYLRNPIMRLFRNNKEIKYQGMVHEVVDLSVRHRYQYNTLEIPIHHYFEEKTDNTLEKRQLKYLEIAKKSIDENQDGRSYATVAAVHYEFKKDYETALKYFKKAIDLGYQINKNKEGMANSLIKLKQYNKAYEIYKELIKEGYITSSVANNTANILLMHKHYKQALKFFKIALAKGNPNTKRINKNIEEINKRLSDDKN